MSRMSFLPLKALQETQWFSRLLFYRHGISTPCLTNSVKAPKEAHTYTAHTFFCYSSINNIHINNYTILTWQSEEMDAEKTDARVQEEKDSTAPDCLWKTLMEVVRGTANVLEL